MSARFPTVVRMPGRAASRVPAACLAVLLAMGAVAGPLGAQSATAPGPLSERSSEPGAPRILSSEVGRAQSRIKALRDAGKFEEAVKLGQEMVQTARAAGDAVGEATTLGLLGGLLESLKRQQEAANAWLGSAALWEKAEHTPFMVEALWHGHMLLPSRSERARQAIDRAVKAALAERVRPRLCAAACRSGGVYLFNRRRLGASRELYTASLALYERVDPDSPSLADALVGIAECHEMEGKYAQAEPFLRRAVAHLERVQPESPRLATGYSELAQVLASDNRLKEAETAYQRGLEHIRRVRPDSQTHGSLLRHYGDLLDRRGDEAGAERQYLQALELLTRFAPRSLSLANTHSVLGELLGRRGRFTEAEQYLLRALAVRHLVQPDDYDYGKCLLDLASLYQMYGRWELARERFQQVVENRQRLDPDGLPVAAVRMQFGGMAEASGNLKLAAEQYEAARAIYETQAAGKTEHARALVRLGNVDYRRGNLQGAWSRLSQGVLLLEKAAPDSYSMGEGLYRLSNVALDRGDAETAAALLDRSRGIVEKNDPRSTLMVQVLTNLGTVAAREGNVAESRRRLEQARDLLRQTPGKPEQLARVLTRLAGLELEAKRPDLADLLLEESLSLLEPLPRHGTAMAFALHARGECRELQGRGGEADAFYRRSLEVWAKRAPRWPARARTLYRLARRVLARGDRKEAVRLAEQAWAVLQNQAQELSGDETLQAFEQTRAPIAAGIAGLLAGEGQLEKALQVVEENRARALQHLLAEDYDRPVGVSDAAWDEYCGARAARTAAEAQVVEAGDRLLIAEKARQNSSAVEKDAAERARAEARVTEHRKQLEVCESALTVTRAREGQLWDQLQGEAAKPMAPPAFVLQLQQAKRLAASGTAVAYFSVGDEETQLFLLSAAPKAGAAVPPVALRSFRIPLGQPAAAARVDACVRALRQQRSEGVSLSRDLCATLFPAPALAALRQAKRIVLVPDGPLWALPFGVLALPAEVSAAGAGGAAVRQPAPLRFLGLEKPLASAPSLALLVQGRGTGAVRKPGQKVRVLAVGDPALKPPGHSLAATSPSHRSLRSALPWEMNLPPLPGTRQDAAAIAGIYGSTPLVGSLATEGAARAALPESDVIHLSTHGYVHPYWARASGVVLSRPADSATDPPTSQDGILQAWELYRGLGTHADLVVLAACETGLGEIVRGEGVNGLVRAFLGTGARSVVASHWKVRDDSTRELMIAFHRAIRSGAAKDEALARAMRQIQARPGWSHPYYWGAFTLTGAAENGLFKPKSSPARFEPATRASRK